MSDSEFRRSFDLEDIAIRADGTGRTVVAYAAVFTPYPVSDVDGSYQEVIWRSAFDRTLAGGIERLRVLFNHGLTVDGTPSDRYSMPLGTPLEVKPDGRGLLTVTRYAKTPLADEVLELVRTGGIRGQSFSGRWVRSHRVAAVRGGDPDVIERQEVALREYGPAPFQVAQAAEILAVRSEPHRPSLRSYQRRLELLRRRAEHESTLT